MAPAALTALKVAGGLFLLWIAVADLAPRRRAAAGGAAGTCCRAASSPASGFGLLTQLANPKPAVFFGAVFVGLVPPGTPWPVLGLLLAVILVDETLWYLVVARVFSLGARPRRLRPRPKPGSTGPSGR